MATAAEQRDLIARLEQDLSTIQSIQRPDAEGAAEHGLEKIPEPIKEATALFYGPSAPASGTLPEGQVDSLLSIISSQRERFRARNQELEAVSHVLPSLTPLGPEDAVGDTQAWRGGGCHLRGVRCVPCGLGGLPGGGYATLGFERIVEETKRPTKPERLCPKTQSALLAGGGAA
uniref:protein CASP-like n=1 Tax=Panthera onca TaxID=9690 RepID=UPI002955377A|nr:protein CASP-like [Panthera onca]